MRKGYIVVSLDENKVAKFKISKEKTDEKRPTFHSFQK